jgi:hypothetical protein
VLHEAPHRISHVTQQLLRHVGSDPPRLVFSDQFGSTAVRVMSALPRKQTLTERPRRKSGGDPAPEKHF